MDAGLWMLGYGCWGIHVTHHHSPVTIIFLPLDYVCI